jgi:hypothetical protein
VLYRDCGVLGVSSGVSRDQAAGSVRDAAPSSRNPSIQTPTANARHLVDIVMSHSDNRLQQIPSEFETTEAPLSAGSVLVPEQITAEVDTAVVAPQESAVAVHPKHRNANCYSH